MKLAELIKNLDYIDIIGDIDKDIQKITFDSTKASLNCLFVAIPGLKKDGRDFISDAIKNGANSILLENKGQRNINATQIIVSDTRKALARISNDFFDNPSGKLKITGITGTNGKTTTTFLINSMLKSAGFNTSFITTIESKILDTHVKFNRTTPESLELNEFFYKSLKKKATHTTMEVSSHAIDLHRVDYIDFKTFVFTNLTQDHLDYHENMENYFNVKKKLFIKKYRGIFKCENAVINIDDLYGKVLYRKTDLNLITFSANSSNADLYAENIINDTSGIKLDILFKGKKLAQISSNLSGYFNVYNILAAAGAAISLGLSSKDIKKGAESGNEICGRFERIKDVTEFTVIVDYAHTPDGLENVLKTAKSLLKNESKLVSVFGCGGDRDKTKRSKMGKIAGLYSDFVFITSDNPRTEDPNSIISMVEEGIKESANMNYVKIPDRKKAIIEALEMVKKGDIVVIAGKGHEDYQEFADYRIHFSDQEVVIEWNKARNRKKKNG